MPGLAGLGNNALLQIVLYNLVGQLVGAVLGPYAQALTNEVMAQNPLVPLAPAELALAVIRNELSEDAAGHEAAMSGVSRERFHTLTRITGEAPGPADLAVALRRGLIDPERYAQGIRQGRLRDEWGELVRELAVAQPTPEAMLQAYLEGQIPEGEARDRFVKLGGDPDYFDILFHSQGQAPTPMEAAEMARRGIIGWDGQGPDAVSFQQAFLEGPWRNKWLDPIRRLSEYLPPPRTVTAMYREGSIDHARAAELLAKQGLAPDLVEAYLSSGSAQKTQAAKDLAQSTIVELYRDRLVKRDVARNMIEGLGYDPTEADFILAIEDTRVAARFLQLAVGRVHTLFVGHKLDRNTVGAVLGQLGIDGAEAGDLIGIWEWERAANVRALTPAEIAQALHVSIIDQATAQARLVELGFTPYDAWLYLSVHEKKALGTAPDASAIGPGPTP